MSVRMRPASVIADHRGSRQPSSQRHLVTGGPNSRANTPATIASGPEPRELQHDEGELPQKAESRKQKAESRKQKAGGSRQDATRSHGGAQLPPQGTRPKRALHRSNRFHANSYEPVIGYCNPERAHLGCGLVPMARVHASDCTRYAVGAFGCAYECFKESFSPRPIY